MLTREELRQQHSIIYQQSTSEIKDDLGQLLGAFKSGHGSLTRQEAGFLVFHHALDGEDTQLELVNAGAVNICLALLDGHMQDLSTPEKTCAAGTLMALCDNAEAREAVARGRSGHLPACSVLHGLLQEQQGTLQLYAAKCLKLLAEDNTSRAILLRAMDHWQYYCSLYTNMMRGCHDSHVVTHLAGYLTALLAKRPDLRDDVVQECLLESCAEALATRKVDSTIQAVLKLLLVLLEDRGTWTRFTSKGGIALLVDTVGPPPKSIMDLEMQQYPHLLVTIKKTQELSLSQGPSEVSVGDGSGGDNTDVWSEPTSPRSPSRSPSIRFSDKVAAAAGGVQRTRSGLTSQKSAKDVNSCVVQEASQGDTIPAVRHVEKSSKSLHASVSCTSKRLPIATFPDIPKEQLLSYNRSALKWGALCSVQMRCMAAGCLYLLSQSSDHMHTMSDRLAANRLAPLLAQVVDAGQQAGSKKGKKAKSLALSPEQQTQLSYVTGCLKFLSLVDVNRYRIAQLADVKLLVSLYQECGHTLLRRNAQALLCNIALQAENIQTLQDAGLPEEFLVPHQAHLAAAEVEMVAKEFPDNNLGLQATLSKQPLPLAQASDV